MITFNLRLKARFIAVWSLSLWALLAIFPPAYETYYPTALDREAFLRGMQQNTGMLALWGPLEPPATIGQIVMWEAGSMLAILSSVMAVLLMVGLHRRSEALGYTELQLSTGIPRGSPARAALATTVIAAIIVGTGATATLWLSGLYVDELPTTGAMAAGAVTALTMTGSALLAQSVLLFVDNPASVTRAGLLSIAASFLVRSQADSREIEVLNWLSPLGWKNLIRPYVENDWRRVAALVVVCAVVGAALIALERRREYGRALVRVPVPAWHRVRRIRGPLHLATVLHRPTIIAWVLVIAVLTGFFIELTGSLTEWMEGEANIGKVFKDIFASDDMTAEFIAYVATLSGILTSVMGVQVIMSYHAGERDRTVDLQRSTGMRRWVPLASATVVSGVGVLLAVVGAAAGGAVGLWSEESTTRANYDTLLSVSLSQLAPALLLTAIAVALVGWVPRVATWSWVPVIASGVLTLFGLVLGLPGWLIELSPFEYAVLPGEDGWWVHAAMGAGALALFVAGCVGSHRREIG